MPPTFQLISKIFSKRNRVFGLDMGTSSLKLAEFTSQEGRLTLCGLKLQPIDTQKDIHLAQLDALKDLFKGIDPKEARVFIVINCPQSTTRILTIPFMPKSEIGEALKWEMQSFISYSLEEAVLDYELLQEVVEGGVKKLRVACACSPQETIERKLKLFNQIGMQPSLFTQAAFALKNVITHLIPDENKTVAVLDIGYTFSELFIFQDKQLSFVRRLPVAGQNFTQGLSQALVSTRGKTQLTLLEAEEIKKRYGLPDSATSPVLADKLTSAQLLSLLRPNVEKLVAEIERTFDFYQERTKGAAVEHLILLGGGSNLKGLARNLAEGLNIPVEFGNPLKRLIVKEPALLRERQGDIHRFAQAIGAALSSADALNLLPVEIKEKTRLLVQRSSIKALVTAIIVILILAYLGMKIRLDIYAKQIAASKLELSVLARKTEEMQKQAFLSRTLSARIFWSDALKELGNLIPAQMRLTEMRTRNKDLILKGEIKSRDLPEERVLTQFMNTLEQGIFKDVTLITTQKSSSPDKLYTFELQLSVE